MSTEYPDVLGDLTNARRRFEVNGVHYLAELDPPVVAPGEATSARVLLQSCWDVPVQVSVSLHLPANPPHAFSVIQPRTDVPLEAAEVGEVRVPIATSAGLVPGRYPISLVLGASYESRGLYVRGQKGENRLGETLLTFETGMALSRTLGLGFVSQAVPEQVLPLEVEGPAHSGPAPDLTPTYLSHWTVQDLPIDGKARHQVNDRLLYIMPQITRQALYLAFLEESQERLRDAHLPLQIGEALFLAKILTFTVEYFFKRPERQEAILVPAFALAYRYNLQADDPVFLIARADYGRIARLATSLSFGLLRKRIGRDIWTIEEQVAVADLVADRVERGGVLPAEFLYLPLLLGGLMVAGDVQMPGEQAAQSLALFDQARQKRTEELAENPELVQLLKVLMKQAAQAA
ncbi:MAG TPA: hypothetical protein VLC95_11785 [Anaerolineae bacterium]|nr:hypothetical protein [Anaerolineae bacterium]